jgi:hypothetical protein
MEEQLVKSRVQSKGDRETWLSRMREIADVFQPTPDWLLMVLTVLG